MINFCDEMTGLAADWRALDTVYLNFSNTSDTVSLKILTKYGMDDRTVRWTEN